jgi:hypothetical protein
VSAEDKKGKREKHLSDLVVSSVDDSSLALLRSCKKKRSCPLACLPKQNRPSAFSGWLVAAQASWQAMVGHLSLSLSLSFQLLPIFAIDFAHVNCQMENGTDVYNLSFPLILTSATRARSREIATGAVAFNHNYTAEQKFLLNHMISR